MPKGTGLIDGSGISGQNPGGAFFAAAMDPPVWTEKPVPYGSPTGKGRLPKPEDFLGRALSRMAEERPCGREA